MKSYHEQAVAVSVAAIDFETVEPGIAKALQDATVTLNALALIGETTVIQNAKIRLIAEEFITEVLKDGRELTIGEIRDYAESFKKILNSKI
jgi:hypothetical protein